MTPITIEITVNAPQEKVWALWTEPEHIKHWNVASNDWHTPSAENDPTTGGKFSIRMEAKDGSFGFDFGGVYTTVIEGKRIEYTLDDDRKVSVLFEELGDGIRILQTFEPETENPVEIQKGGWQAILNNFKAYAERNAEET